MAKWKPDYYRVGSSAEGFDATPTDPPRLRRIIEPWLSSIFQCEHLSLLLGSGFTNAIGHAANAATTTMGKIDFGTLDFAGEVDAHAVASAKATGRGSPNIEDQIRSALLVHAGLDVIGDARAAEWKNAIDKVLLSFMKSILKTEEGIRIAFDSSSSKGLDGKHLLTSFLLSFASRAVSRERLNLFTTNYDRLVEYGCDLTGLRVIDRFVGALSPVFRSSRVEVDLHYNPPGIRGEPRYLEGVLRLTKLHGSVDWRQEERVIRRYGIPFGAPETHPDLPAHPLDSLMIYPNPAKDIETAQYPYAELFRDLSSALCRPNSVLVTYGYGFGDDHINRVIGDMLTIPSTHLVIISFDDASGRIPRFCDATGREAQISLLIGKHFGDLPTLVEHYLPKPALDQITWRQAELLRKRGETDPAKGDGDPAGSPAGITMGAV